MNNAERQLLLTYQRLPARLDVEQTAVLLGFMPYEIPVLMKAKLLKPLGEPMRNSRKFFSSAEILALAQDRQWLDKATKIVSRRWQMKNKYHKNLLDAA